VKHPIAAASLHVVKITKNHLKCEAKIFFNVTFIS